MKERIRKSFDFAADLVKQLIALSTGVIALTITFANEIVGTAKNTHNAWLVSAWLGFFLSIIFGIWALMALTGTLDPVPRRSARRPKLSIQGANCRLPTALQILSFLVAVALTIMYAVKSL